ncbi:MAG: Dabb family protein [Eubacteriales bacterium]
MIKHMIMTKLKDNSEANCQRAYQLLTAMKEEIDVVIDVEVGVDFLHSERSFDIGFVVTVATIEDLGLYQNASYHVNHVLAFMQEHAAHAIAVDYQC